MGEIAKQSINNNLFIGLGVIFGFLTRGLIIPRYIEPELIGNIDYIISVSTLLSSIFIFGTPVVILKEFPKYINNKTWTKFIRLNLKISLIGFILGCVTYFFYSYLTEEKSGLTQHLVDVLIIILFASKLISSFVDTMLRVQKKTTIGSFLNDFVSKFLFFLVIILFTLKIFNKEQTVIASAVVFLTTSLILLTYYRFNHKVSTDDRIQVDINRNEIINIATYSVLTVIGSVVILEIDRIMIFHYLGSEETGIYSSMFFFGMIVSIPSRGLKRISTTFLSEFWNKNDIVAIQDIYKKSAILQLIIASIIFLTVYFSIDYLFPFMKAEYSQGKLIVLFIGLAKLTDMATGVNYEIISTSKKYKFNTYSLLILFVALVSFNALLIPTSGINGAAIGSFLSILILNIWRTLYLIKQYKLSPLSKNYFKVLTLFILVFTILSLIKLEIPIYLGVPCITLIILLTFVIPIYKMQVSADFNGILNKFIRLLKK